MKKWYLLIDIEKCENCNNCFLSCKDEHVDNDWPGYSAPQPNRGQKWINIHGKERGQYPFIDVAYLPVPCMHCANAPCIKAAKDGAIYKRPDGIIIIDPVKAKGQKNVINACPYGAIWWNEELGVPQKCTFCAHLLDDGLDVNRLERYLAKEIERFRKRVFGKVLQEIEEKKLEEAKGRVSRREKVPRYLFTRLGLIRFERHKVKYKDEGRFGFLLDDVLGLKPYQGETKWVRRRALELAVEYPYRQARSLLRHEIGDEISYRTIHRWAQEEGKKLREEEEARQEAIFGRAEKVRGDGKEREIVVLEVDGTLLHSQEKGEDNFEAKLGIMYSGKELESKKAKHRRYRLKEKVIYGGIEGADDFGERLYLKGEEKLSLSLAKNLLLISDGARWISDIAGADYLKATYQLDWWHYEKKLRAALPGEVKLQQELLNLLREGRREEHRRLLKLKRLVDGPSEKLDDLLGYLEENWNGIYGSRNLEGKVGAQEVLVVGSGGIEKNIDLMLCRRFKGRGMSWSRAGAQNLLKLRLLRHDRKDWKAYWRRRVN